MPWQAGTGSPKPATGFPVGLLVGQYHRPPETPPEYLGIITVDEVQACFIEKEALSTSQLLIATKCCSSRLEIIQKTQGILRDCLGGSKSSGSTRTALENEWDTSLCGQCPPCPGAAEQSKRE